MKKNEGFVTDDFYAAVPCGKIFVIIYNGYQIGDASTIKQAHKFIQKHREQNPTGIEKFTE